MSDRTPMPVAAGPRPVPLTALLRPPEPPTPSAAPLAQALEAAHAEGRAQAFEQQAAEIAALQAALEAARAEQATEATQCRDTLTSMARAMEATLATEVAALALAAAGAILATRPALQEATLASLIAEAAGGLPHGTLFVPPAQLPHAGALVPPNWQIAARDGLEWGVVEAELGPALQRAALGSRLEQLLERAP